MRRPAIAALLLASLLNHARAQDTKAVFVYSAGKMSPVAQLTPQGITDFGPGDGDVDQATRWLSPWVAPERKYYYVGRDGGHGTGASRAAC